MKVLVSGMLLGFGLMLGSATAVQAHAVQTDYFVDLFAAELELEFTATFSTGEPMQAATVLVYAPDNLETPWEESQTDELGKFTFAPDAKLAGDWRIEFIQEGHQDIRIVPVDEMGIDYQNISRGYNQDVHFASGLGKGSLALFSIAAVGTLAFAFKRSFSKDV